MGVLDVTFAEQAAAEDAALLESITKAVDYEIPTNLVVGRQPYEAQEMAPIAFYPYLYVTNADNEQIMAIESWRRTSICGSLAWEAPLPLTTTFTRSEPWASGQP